ncbi:MAG TPA: ribonuclease HI [Holophaga sp.]|nr:ribonuclease HI [Holophaga sp.]
MEVELYCDGACLGNPGPGGWAYLLRVRTSAGPKEKEAAGAEPDTTNNRMELMGAIMGLKALTRTCSVDLYCDSQYVVKGIQSWIKGWKAKGWRKADGKPVLNEELWRELDAQVMRHHVTAHWVRGHAGHTENERVDRLASDAAKGMA